MFESYIRFLTRLFMRVHVSPAAACGIAETLSALTLLAAAVLTFYVVCLIVDKVVVRFIRHTPSKRDDILVKNHVFKRLCLLIPAYMIRCLIDDALPGMPQLSNFIVVFTKVFEAFVYARVADAVLTTLYDIYNTCEVSRTKPLMGFLQVARILVYFVFSLVVVAILTGKQLSSLLIGLGTLSAILMLVFKDTILGFVGSIQLAANDMLRIGDWIVMDRNKADGEVQEIGLTAVKVKNWDQTVTTIPTYSLVSEAFTNWRGMAGSGGRRICRSVCIDAGTVKFCTPEMLERYRKFRIVSDYIEEKEKEIRKYNEELNAAPPVAVNGRRQTNIGVFRRYLLQYLMDRHDINHGMTCMVRQLEPTDNGIPIQVYCFVSNTDWGPYEDVQSDIFDHIYAVVPLFDLKVYQRPSSGTFERAAGLGAE